MLTSMYTPLIMGTNDNTQFRTNAITRAQSKQQQDYEENSYMNHLLGKEILARDNPDPQTPPPQPETDEESEILDKSSYLNYIKNASVADMAPLIDSSVVEAI